MCRPIQNPSDMPKNRESRSPVSMVTARFALDFRIFSIYSVNDGLRVG